MVEQTKPPLKSRKRSISLILPSFQKQANQLQSIAVLEKQSRELHHYPVQGITEIRRYLQSFNRCKLKTNRRYELNERCLSLSLSTINSVFSRYHKVHPLPENDEKRELLSLTSDVCNELAISYMRVFSHDLNLSIIRYRGCKTRIAHCAHRIMELLYTEQRLRSLRYQRLSANTWVNLNSVYYAMHRFEDHLYRQKSLELLKLTPTSVKPKTEAPAQISVGAIYKAIHLYSYIDTLSMATQQIHIAAMQVEKFADQLAIKEQAAAESVADSDDQSIYNEKESYIFTYADHDYASRINTTAAESIGFRITVSDFQKNAQHEYEKMRGALLYQSSTQSSTNNEQGVVTTQEDIERLIAFSHILQRLDVHDRTEERHYIGHVDPLFIYNGYKLCFKTLAEIRTGENINEQNTDFRDLLSQRSATITDDDSTSACSQWQLSNSSARGALAVTKETRFTHSMFVGQLLLYGVDDISTSEYNLAYIGRMHRDVADNLQIAIINLSKQVELVAVQTSHLAKTGLALPGILLADYNDGLALVLHSGHRLGSGSAINFSRSKTRYNYCIGPIDRVQREFTVYQLVSA